MNGPRWIPIAAAVLAVLASVCGWLSHDRDTLSDRSKSDAIIAVVREGHAYNEYEGLRIRQLNRGPDGAGEAALLRKAEAFDADAERATERSGRLLHSHEILEVATTLFEVGIVLVSVRALVASRLLTIASAFLGAAGIVAAIVGFLS